MTVIFLSGSTNPDSGSIVNKEQIDISLSSFDVSASEQSNVVQTNYSFTVQSVFVDTNVKDGSVYYTPIYKENIDYEEWLKRIDRNFQELN
jgi:hypothetical protein